MAQGKYISTDDLRTRLTNSMFLAIFDDDRQNDIDKVNDDAVQQVIEGAEAEVDSYVILTYNMPLPTNVKPRVDRLIKLATLDYAEALCFLRHPEYPRTFGENGKSKGCWGIAEKRMERLSKALQRLPDIAEKLGIAPNNVGGFVGVNDPRSVDEDEDSLLGNLFRDTGIF